MRRKYPNRGPFKPACLLALAFLISPSSLAASPDIVLEGFSFNAGSIDSIELKFRDSNSIMATDEHGRRCVMKGGKLMPFAREEETFWRLETSPESVGPLCRDGMIFKIRDGRFVRHDHGFNEIFKYYATRACSAAGRALTEDEAQVVADCFLKRDKWATVKALYDWYLNTSEKKYPLREACTKQLLSHINETVICSDGFKKLGEESVFLDVVVIKEGSHQIRGGGSNASNYILHPDFRGEIDLRGHGRVFHLVRHKCSSPDIFRGCTVVGGN